MRLAVAALVAVILPPAVRAQQSTGPSRCYFQLDSVGRQGSVVVAGTDTNYFAGGNVYLRCQGTSTTMRSDSLASYAGKTVKFIGHVRYRDSTLAMDADLGTYYRAGERWEARGRVVTRNLKTGSKLTGPYLDYLREMAGLRDTFEMFAKQRPRIEYITVDSSGKPGEPYIIVADRVRFKGNDRIWAGGKVTIDRSDFAARGDSLYLDTGPAGTGTLIGGDPVLRGTKADSFNLRGKRIDFRLKQRDLTQVVAKGEGRADSKDWHLTADTIVLDLEQQAVTHAVAQGSARADSKDWHLTADTIAFDVKKNVVERTLAWGHSSRPFATSANYAMKADSLALDTPDQKLREIRGFGAARLDGDVDSLSGERDWMAGDTVVAAFDQRDSAGVARTALNRIVARHAAQSYHVDANPRSRNKPSINYTRADTIVVTMMAGNRRGVERVDARGQVDGAHLEETAAASSPDSTPRPPRSPGGP